MDNREIERNKIKKCHAILHGTFDSDTGKEALEWLSVECMEHQQTLDPENFAKTAFNEGKRSVIRRIRTALAIRLD